MSLLLGRETVSIPSVQQSLISCPSSNTEYPNYAHICNPNEAGSWGGGGMRVGRGLIRKNEKKTESEEVGRT